MLFYYIGLIKNFSLHLTNLISNNFLPPEANVLLNSITLFFQITNRGTKRDIIHPIVVDENEYAHVPKRVFYLLVVDENEYAHVTKREFDLLVVDENGYAHVPKRIFYLFGLDENRYAHVPKRYFICLAWTKTDSPCTIKDILPVGLGRKRICLFTKKDNLFVGLGRKQIRPCTKKDTLSVWLGRKQIAHVP